MVRSGGRVRKERFGELGDALAALRKHGEELERSAHGDTRGGTFIRRLEPVQQVIARLELSGPGGLRGGIDVRGDGSSEAFTGRMRRSLVEQRRRENAYDALARELTAR
jgi:hypothetical protein